MLTQALVHPYCRRDSILPRFVGFTQENLLLCEQLIGLFHNALDRRESRGQLDENVKAVLAETTRRSLGLGIVKLLEDRTDFSSSSQLDFQTLRKEILDASAQLLRGNDTLPQFGHYEETVEKVEKMYKRGFISEDERYEKVIEKWSKTTEDVANA